jgi:hypothetical protein
MNVTNEIKVYEQGGSKYLTIKEVTIKSHNDKDFVVLRVGNDITLTLFADDVIRAVNNSRNS